MQPHFHAIVWIDHQQAKVFHIGLSGRDQVDLHPHLQTRHIHDKVDSIGSGHVHEDKELIKGVADVVSDAGETLIIGSAAAKTELAKHLREQTAGRTNCRHRNQRSSHRPRDRGVRKEALQDWHFALSGNCRPLTPGTARGTERQSRWMRSSSR